MKPYGVKRFLCFKYPDLQECLEIGIKSKYMKMKSKTRKSSRRVHKSRERSSVKYKLYKEIE